jgi:hypothetical protein
MNSMHWYMVPCPDCKTENWLTDLHFNFLKTKYPSFVVCRKCGKPQNPPMGLMYSMEWHQTLTEMAYFPDKAAAPTSIMEADAWPGMSSFAPKFEGWLMKLMRVRDKCPEVAQVVDEMKACMKTREPEPGEGEEEICC